MLERTKKAFLAVVAVAAVAVGGAAIGAAATSGSATTTTTTTTTKTQIPAHGSAAHEDAEKPVTGDAATKAKAAAVKTVPGTAGAVTTDYPGTGYEVTVTKADGTTVEVHLDSSFTVVQGHGGHGHGFDGPAHGTAAHEDAEKPVTGDAATKAKAAAVKAVPGNAGAVTTDFDGDGYEVTVTKADGTTVEVHLDSSFTVMQGHHGFGR